MLYSKYNNHLDLYGLALPGVCYVCLFVHMHAYTITQHSLWNMYVLYVFGLFYFISLLVALFLGQGLI